jgi:hypothetical protein
LIQVLGGDHGCIGVSVPLNPGLQFFYMVHLHDQIANLGLELFVLGFELAFPLGWTIDQRVVAVLLAPVLDQTSRELMLASGLLSRHLPGLDLGDELTFEFGFEFSTNFSHYEYPAPLPQTAKIGGREGLWKMPQLWKSTKVAFGTFFLMISTSCLEKPPQKTLRLFHIYHSPDHY